MNEYTTYQKWAPKAKPKNREKYLRTKKDYHHLSIRVSNEDMKEIRKLAKEWNTNLNETVNTLITWGMRDPDVHG
jgi:hypothetical protein